jgi:hypothetical protein
LAQVEVGFKAILRPQKKSKKRKKKISKISMEASVSRVFN